MVSYRTPCTYAVAIAARMFPCWKRAVPPIISGTSFTPAMGMRSRPRRITKVPSSIRAPMPPRPMWSSNCAFSPSGRVEKYTRSPPVRSRMA